MGNWQKAYERWRNFSKLDPELIEQLKNIQDDEVELEDAFHKELAFGTGGMRGVLGPGRNRMNIYTVRRAVYGLGKYLMRTFDDAIKRGVVVAYDSRHKSKDFAIECARVLGTFGIRTYVFETLRPTPLLSYAVRYLETTGGIMITASHNPPEYNGFKVYNEDGGQITPEEADRLMRTIQESGDELRIPAEDKKTVQDKGLLRWLEDEVDQAYLAELKRISMLDEQAKSASKDMPLVFTPLHGTAYDLVKRGLEQMNFTGVHVVEAQAEPDPEFSTVDSPNPEEHQAFWMAEELGKERDAEILLAADPDADRLGVAVKNGGREYTVLNGNQLGVLLLDYILGHTDAETLSRGRVLKTIVTTEMGRKVADTYGVKTIDVLTGFKFISEKIRGFDLTGEAFLFGFEESYGYLISDFTRDKDAVQAALLAVEMAYFYRNRGQTLLDALEELYEEHGYYMESLVSLTLEGKEGSEQIGKMMEAFRSESFTEIGGLPVEATEDYQTGKREYLADGTVETIHLPQENVLKLLLAENCWVCFRPSGTEPKIKCYYGVSARTREGSAALLDALGHELENQMHAMTQSD